MKSEFFSPELTIRHKKIQTALVECGADACLISTNVNMLYVAGRVLNGYCYVPVEGNPVFFLRRPVGIEGENVHYIRKPEQITELLQEIGLPLPSHILLEAGEIPHLDFLRLEDAIQAKTVGDCTHLLRQVRAVKTTQEIEFIKESARLQSEMFTELPKLYQAGMTDTDLAIITEQLLRKKGCMPNMRIFGSSMEGNITCVWAGENAEAPSPYDFSLGGAGTPAFPIGENGTVLKEGMAVMIDSGCNVKGYLSDQTRTFSVGRLSKKAYDIHQVSLEIQNELMHLAKPGTVCEDVYNTCIKMVEKHDLIDSFMGTVQQAPFVGHGVGLVINELPILCDRNKMMLEPNMVIAIEPKFVIKGVGAVGTENTYVVKENGLEKITTAIEKIVKF